MTEPEPSPKMEKPGPEAKAGGEVQVSGFGGVDVFVAFVWLVDWLFFLVLLCFVFG